MMGMIAGSTCLAVFVKAHHAVLLARHRQPLDTAASARHLG